MEIIMNKSDKEKLQFHLNYHIKQNICVLMLDVLIPYYSDQISNCLGNYDDNDFFNPAMEYWLISEHLYQQLRSKGQPVVKFKNLYIWGRLGTGYSLTDEEVLIDIFLN